MRTALFDASDEFHAKAQRLAELDGVLSEASLDARSPY